MRSQLIMSLLLGSSLSACSLVQLIEQTEQDFSQNQALVQTKHAEFNQAISDQKARQASQEVDKPWIVGKAQPLARELSLPAPLRARVRTVLLFADGADDLRRMARRIATVTGIPVHVRPDALLAAHHFLPRLSGAETSPEAERSENFEPFDGGDKPAPLPIVLDRLSAHFGVRWRYANERIEFYRTETRVFGVQALTMDAKVQASIGLGKSERQGGFNSSSGTQLESIDQDALKIIRARIEPFMSRAGVLVAESGAGASVVVTDLPENLQEIGRYLEQENRALTRRVRLIFEELTVAMDEQAQASLDWNLVFNNAKLAAGMAVPAMLADGSSQLSLAAIDGKLAGSEAVIRALGEKAQLVRRSTIPMLTLNRRPVTHAVRTTFSYIDKIETTPLASDAVLSVPAVSVNQKEETVGSLLTLVPDVQDDGQILLSLAYDNTVAQPLKSVNFGDKTNPLQLQQLTVDGNGTVQQLALQPGQPLVVSGFERRQTEASEKRLNPDMPLIFGGGNQVADKKLATVLIITAQVEEGL